MFYLIKSYKMASNMEQLVHRLEAVTARLENVAARGGEAESGDSTVDLGL